MLQSTNWITKNVDFLEHIKAHEGRGGGSSFLPFQQNPNSFSYSPSFHEVG